jgi:uncharacterized RmlC-like cupin family protein
VTSAETDYRLHGVRIVRADELDPNTAQTPGMHRAAAITAARAGAEKLWGGTVVIDPDAKTGAHHHGHVESVIYVITGQARMRWGDRLEYTADAGPATSSTFRRSCPIKRSTPTLMNHCGASWCAATRKLWWSTSTCSTSTQIRNRCSGSMTSTRHNDCTRDLLCAAEDTPMAPHLGCRPRSPESGQGPQRVETAQRRPENQ